MDTKTKSLRVNPALIAGIAFILVVAGWVAENELGPLIKLPERPIQFAHPLSAQLDTMMREDSEVLVIGDPDFIGRMKQEEQAFGGTVQYFELPQVDLYAVVAIFPAILRSQAKLVVLESIPAYWSGEVFMAVQPPASAVDAAVQQVSETVPTPITPSVATGREYIISPPQKPFNIAEPSNLVFDNYSGYWREIDECLLWITNDSLLAEAPAEFQKAYHEFFADPEKLHTNIGHVGSVENAAPLLEQCRASRSAEENPS